MSIAAALLGLLEAGPQHGYALKKTYDGYFGQDRVLDYGQVYATLSRLLRDGLVEQDGVEPGAGPSRRRYAVTSAGVTDVATWLATPELPAPYLQNEMYAKVIIALLSDRSAHDVLDVQRTAHLATMRELTARRRGGDLADILICDYALFHLEADLRWLELTADRLAELRNGLRRA